MRGNEETRATQPLSRSIDELFTPLTTLHDYVRQRGHSALFLSLELSLHPTTSNHVLTDLVHQRPSTTARGKKIVIIKRKVCAMVK